MSKKRETTIIQLRQKVRDLLLNLDPVSYPGIATILNRADGYRQMENMLLNYAATNQISLSAAINQLEMELS
ncbi:hypothetical protein OKW21_005044 [Catalinimonas alkaloidigena]|uniref:hypothetical protein n=1 Tax=Catalinimonas alkaloidigena TaxID=1075417 RepID=UPI00240571F7|nr:hypothetical protein [Catalinimonas alkaloidigena]MDF9799781.1 hypothetical protein [Catalinimonas alkaloidigena]